MSLDLVYYGHPALRSKGKKIDSIDKNIRELAAQMIDTMYDYDGCGLAAQQVGRSLQLAVIDVIAGMKSRPSKAWQNGKLLDIEQLMPLVLINPEIIASSKKRVDDKEGCLSIPGIYTDIQRPTKIKIRYQSLSGDTLELESTGLLARAIMHEMDHLNGILFIDYLSSEELQEYQPILKKLVRDHTLG